MRHAIALALMLILVGVGFAQDQSTRKRTDQAFAAKDVATANTLVQTLHIADWLGPMAPLALSPFFGITVLSGLALFGPEWATDNALLSAAGPLHNHTLFVVFLVLTVLTSLPRLSKVSKPFAQAVDQVETFSVIVILMAIKFLADMSGGEHAPVAMVQLGVISVTADVLLAIAMIVNIIVINSVKFFFEFLVWLTPIPTLDAIFEVCNKSLCAVLMAIYALSPTIATIINLVILLTAAVMFRWASRQVRFFRTMVVDLLLSRLWPGYGATQKTDIVVFTRDDIGAFKQKSRLTLSKTDSGWLLSSASWFAASVSQPIDATAKPTIRRGWLMHSIDLIHEGDAKTLSFSRKHDRCLDELARQLGLQVSTPELDEDKNHERIAREFA